MTIRTALTAASVGLALLLGSACELGPGPQEPAVPESTRAEATAVFTAARHTSEAVECIVDVLFAPDVPAAVRDLLVEANRGGSSSAGPHPFATIFPEGTSDGLAAAVGGDLDRCLELDLAEPSGKARGRTPGR